MPPAVAPTNYKGIGQQVAQANGIPWNIFDALVNQESGWNPAAVSPVGAKNLTQLMPGTAKGLGVTNLDDPVQALQGGAKYLKMMYQKFGRWDLALAAYNAGPGAVSKYGGIPPYAETQNYVKTILNAAAGGGGGQGAGGKPGAGQSGLPPIGGTIDTPTIAGIWGGGKKNMGATDPLQNMLNFAGPSDDSVSQLGSLGGIAQRAAQAAQRPIDPGAQLGMPNLSLPGLVAPPGAKSVQNPYAPEIIPVKGGLNGQAPMITGGNIAQRFPNIRANSNVDWEHVNPRLLQVINDQAAKMGTVAVLNSGYRSNQYSQGVGGFANDPHTKGLAVDAYINGHPVGDVIPPEVWAKLGVRSGNTPGFYQGKPDPEHLDLIGIPVKGGPKA